MGQAFDERGNTLGDAFGDTKEEVFKKLDRQFPDAFEIRIKKALEDAAKREDVIADEILAKALFEETPNESTKPNTD